MPECNGEGAIASLDSKKGQYLVKIPAVDDPHAGEYVTRPSYSIPVELVPDKAIFVKVLENKPAVGQILELLKEHCTYYTAPYKRDCAHVLKPSFGSRKGHNCYMHGEGDKHERTIKPALMDLLVSR